jgi:hypothetical protein
MKIKGKVNRKLSDRVSGVFARQIKLAVERHASMNSFSARDRRALRYITEKLIEALQVNAAVNADLAGLPQEVVLTAVFDSIAGWRAEIDKMISPQPEYSKS